MATPPDCRTKLLTDAPVSQDEFGAHSRIANSIADLILTEDGGKSIGLEGGWGTGKSTVLNLTRIKLETNDNTAFVVFDAWAHQGDPLRRTFLETLIIQLSSKKWIDGIKWHQLRQELTQRRRIEEQKTFPRLGIFGGILIVGLFLIPLGLSLLGIWLESNGATAQNVADLSFDWRFALGICLSLNPIILFLLALFCWVIFHRFQKQPTSFRSFMSEWGGLLTQRFETSTRTETTESPDPTSVEFNAIFSSLMIDALSVKDRHLVIALDNLDRVVSSDALAILAALQTFFQQSEHRKPSWFNGLWVVIPYDRDAIQNLWGGADSTENAVKLASAFIEKTFQVRFEVPPLLFTNWRSYLLRLLATAFPDHRNRQGEFHDVYKVYELHRQESDSSPTPRGLKLFVNQIGTIHRQWGDLFPLAQVAHYVLLRHQRKDVGHLLIKGDPSGWTANGLLDATAHSNLAAMLFNSDPSEALQLLLHEPLYESISQRNQKGIEELANTPGFWEVFERFQFRGWVGRTETHLIAYAATCYAAAAEVAKPDPSIADSITKSLQYAASIVTYWEKLDSDLAEGLVTLFRLSPSPDFAETLINSISSNLESSKSNRTNTKVEDWVQGALLLLNGLQKYVNTVAIPYNARDTVEVFSLLWAKDPSRHFWSCFKPTIELDLVVGQLGEWVANGNFTSTGVNAIDVMLELHTISWSPLVMQIEARLAAPISTLPPQELEALLGVLWKLQKAEPAAKSVRETLSTQGHILHHLYHCHNRDGSDAVAWCVFTFLDTVPSAAQGTSFGDSVHGYGLLTNGVFGSPQDFVRVTEAFLKILRQTERHDLLFAILDNVPSAKAWIVSCLRSLADSDYATKMFDPQLMLGRWQLLQSEFGSTKFNALIERLSNEADLGLNIARTQFDVSNAGLYASIALSAGVTSPEFAQWCVGNLDEVDQGTWSQQLQSEGDLLELLVNLLFQRIDIGLKGRFQDALIAHARMLMHGKVEPSRFRTVWNELPNALASEPNRATLRRVLLRNMENMDGDIASRFFELYVKEISDSNTIRENPNIVTLVFSPIVRKQNVAGLQWISNLLSNDRDLLHGYTPADAVVDFKQRIGEALEAETEPDTRALLEKIGEISSLE